MKVLTFPELKTAKGVPYSRVHLRRLEAAGQFPRRVRLGPADPGKLRTTHIKMSCNQGGPVQDEHPILQLIQRRATVEQFDPTRGLDDELICTLVRDAIRAPSSFNIQHWRFVAVRRAPDKQRLCEAAYGQTQVREAAVTFIILGDLQGADRLPEIMAEAVQQGVLPQAKATAWIRMAGEIYADEGVARDEAIRSASLAAMTLMLVAEARGLAAGALSGFDAERVRREFGIDDRYLPVMLLVVGHALRSAPSRMPRLDVAEVLAFDRWDGRGS